MQIPKFLLIWRRYTQCKFICAFQAASDWLYIVPWGLKNEILWITQRYGKPPIYVTENGKYMITDYMKQNTKALGHMYVYVCMYVCDMHVYVYMDMDMAILCVCVCVYIYMYERERLASTRC